MAFIDELNAANAHTPHKKQGSVQSVNGKTGDVVITAADVSDDATFASPTSADVPSTRATKVALDTKLDDTQLDTDATLAADSDSKIASQKATKAKIAALSAAPGPIGSTTPSTGAFTTLAAGSGKDTIDANGLHTKSNNLALVAQGNPLILGLTSQKAETTTADANVLTVTPASAAGVYRVSVSIDVASATSGVVSWTLAYTDSEGNAVSDVAQQLFQMGTAAPNVTFTTSAAGRYHGSVLIGVNNAGANIVVKWVGGGTISAKVTAMVERVA